MSLRWRKNPKDTGLRAVCAETRGSTLYKDKTLRCATVAKSRQGGWFWVGGWESGIPLKNTSNNPEETEKAAKNMAMAYVKGHLET